ncbi:MAG: hypothetical protein DI596_06295, partial [Azospira oryzae]
AQEQARIREHAQQLAQESAFTQALENLRRTARQVDVSRVGEDVRRQIEALRASETRTQTAERSAAVSLERAEALREMAQRASSGERIIHQDFTTRVLDRLEREEVFIDGARYAPGTLTREEAMRIYHSGQPAARADLMRAINRIAQQEIDAYVLTQAQNLPGAADIKAWRDANRPAVPDTAAIHAEDRARVMQDMPAPAKVSPAPMQPLPEGSPGQPDPRLAGQMRALQWSVQRAAETPQGLSGLAAGAWSQFWDGMPTQPVFETAHLFSPQPPGQHGASGSWEGEGRGPGQRPDPLQGAADTGRQAAGELTGTHQTASWNAPEQESRSPGATGSWAPEPTHDRPQAAIAAAAQDQEQPGQRPVGDNPLTGVPGSGNPDLGKLFQGGRPPVAHQPQQPEGAGERKQDDAPPPPSNR